MRHLPDSTPWLILGLLAASAAAADPICDPVTGSGCTVGDVYRAAYGSEYEAVKESIAAVQENIAEAAIDARRAPKATTAPPTFASRFHSSYEDFLNVLSFAVNDVEESEDGKAFVVRFNPIQAGTHRLALSLTAAEPQIADVIVRAIAENGRADTVSQLEDELEDFDDLTMSAGYTISTEACRLGLDAKRCFGRDPDSYVAVLSSLIPEPPSGLSAANSLDTTRMLTEALEPGPEDLGVFEMRLSDDPEKRSQQIGLIRTLAREDAGETRAEVERLEKAGSELFWPLIDNQPQISVTISRREAERLVGSSSSSVSLELQFGSTNLNSLFRDCSTESRTCAMERLRRLAARKTLPGVRLVDGKFVLTASYTERERLTLSSLPVEHVAGSFAGISIPRTSELRAKLQWGARISSEIDGWSPRLDFSAEGFESEEDGFRVKSRWVAAATLTLPVADGLTVPVSVNWANKPEFLGDPDRTFGAHVGLSFSVDRKKK